ncbi:hypothetical protein [Meiothermus sp. CFH 77666]|uniref:hypothetical protein n=1 Tax=Meiothermus sp. CFH 77666 TaxID=2817942 RepID=UPI001AA0A385|nr:hypothetical protein [Meiothermus sp. CFH 77666]
MYETLVGSVLQVQTASIHGVVFYDVVLQTDSSAIRVRFQDTFLNPAPKPGEYLKVELILGNVSDVQRIPAP